MSGITAHADPGSGQVDRTHSRRSRSPRPDLAHPAGVLVAGTPSPSISDKIILCGLRADGSIPSGRRHDGVIGSDRSVRADGSVRVTGPLDLETAMKHGAGAAVREWSKLKVDRVGGWLAVPAAGVSVAVTPAAGVDVISLALLWPLLQSEDHGHGVDSIAVQRTRRYAADVSPHGAAPIRWSCCLAGRCSRRRTWPISAVWPITIRSRSWTCAVPATRGCRSIRPAIG